MSDIEPMSDDESNIIINPYIYETEPEPELEQQVPIPTNLTNKPQNFNQTKTDTQLKEDFDLFELDSLGLTDSTDEINIQNKQNESYFNKNDELKMIYLRSFLKKVEKSFQEKDLITQKIRQEILGCKKRIEDLEQRRDQIFQRIETAQNENNITIVNRLDSEHANLCREIELEDKVLEKLTETFNNADYERSKALLEKTKYAQLNLELKQNEEVLLKQKEIKSLERKREEDKKCEILRKKLEKEKQIENEKIRLENLKQKEAIEQAKLARQITNNYLKQTLREMKDQKAYEETQLFNENESKRKELINLKNVVDQNKEIFQAKVNKNKFLKLKYEQDLIEEKNAILERGENPNFFIPRKIKMEEFEKNKKKFEQEQEKNTQEIVKKILKENENLEKKKKLYPNLFNINLKQLKPISKTKEKHDLKLLTKVASSLGFKEESLAYLKPKSEEKDDDDYEKRSIYETTTIASEKEDDDSDFDELNNQDEMMVRPEFEGLWNKQLKKYDAQDLYKIQEKFPTCFKTKTEKELYLKTLEKLKKSAIKEQVVAGKKFVGISFKSQPKIVHFKDFDVGKTYNIKIVLTNISYSINTCKFIDITEKLKDFITIDFQPPGQLSAGLTCEFNVTFEPKINKDLEGEIKFLSTNGPFSIPISCTIKKCDISVNTNLIHFGTIVIGEQLNRKIQLINKGALGTNFKILTQNELENSTENSEENRLDEFKEDGIKLGQIKNGFIGPFSTIDLDFDFFPTFPGKFQENFTIKFDDENSKKINLVSKATAIDVPIWIENLNIDLKICMYDRLFQEVIKVHNRASAALRVTFDVPQELKNHLEILPKTAFIQAKSEFSAQIKFIAKKSLPQDAPGYFDMLTGVLEVPLHIKVADQNKTVDYNLHAIVTTSDLEFDVKEIDFGYCTIYETVKATVYLTNKSILCQPFGFVKLPDYVNVQPNDGFGTLLPNETIPIDINFCPKSAKEFKFQVLCKSLVNRDFIINCRGIGVHPPLKLSAQRINFKATALNSSSFRTLFVVNDHVDYDQHRHPVPRIGSGEIATVGPTHFEFDLPENCPFKLWPTVGCVEPGKKCKITIQYTANLNELEIKREAAKLIKNKMVERAKQITSSEQNLSVTSNDINNDSNEIKEKPVGKKIKNQKTTKPESSMSVYKQIDLNPKTPEPEQIETGSNDYLNGLSHAYNNYPGGLQFFQVPCYISSVSSDSNISYSIHNTIYLDVVCPSVKPEMVIISKDMSRTIDFGKVSIGHKCIKKISIKNISNSTIELTSNLLDPNGPFLFLNALRPIEPGTIHNLMISFEPNKACVYHENFEIKTEKSNLNFTLNAVGVEPSFSLSYEQNSLDFGYCLANEKSEKMIEMRNNSKVPIEFKVTLDSRNEELKKENEFKRFKNANDLKYKPPLGPNNHSGLSSFDVFPIQGSIAPGSKVDLKIIFSPDHTSELYADTLRISLISTENSKVIQLIGKSRKKNIYIRGVDYLTSNSNSESMVLLDFDPIEASNSEEQKDEKSNKADKNADKTTQELIIPTPILLTLYSISSSKTVGEYSLAEKNIFIGCMKSNAEANKKDVKKNGDFSFDNLKDINSKGFNIDLPKSAVEAGGERQIKITWKPPQGIDPKQTVQGSILLTTKSNSTEVWKLILEGRIVSESYQV